MRKVGFAGLGIMGSRMAARLVARGFDVTVWDKDALNVGALVAKGARVASEPAAIVRDADVVVTMLWDDAVAEEIVGGQLIPAAHPGTTFIEMTTITPAMQRQLAAAAQTRGCDFLDSPVTGSKEQAERGELGTLVGGREEVLEKNRDVLETMTAKITHVGPNGASGAVKLANNQLIALAMSAWGESVRMAEAAGVDRAFAIQMFAGTFGRVAEMKWRSIIAHDFEAHFTLDAILKDIKAALRTAESAYIDLPVLRAALPQYEAAFTDGDGRSDFSIIVDRIASASTRQPEPTVT